MTTYRRHQKAIYKVEVHSKICIFNGYQIKITIVGIISNCQNLNLKIWRIIISFWGQNWLQYCSGIPWVENKRTKWKTILIGVKGKSESTGPFFDFFSKPKCLNSYSAPKSVPSVTSKPSNVVRKFIIFYDPKFICSSIYANNYINSTIYSIIWVLN